jgi:hypothetical protein
LIFDGSESSDTLYLAKVWYLRALLDLNKMVRILFLLRGEYSCANDCLVMKKSVFSRLIMQQLNALNGKKDVYKVKLDIYMRNVDPFLYEE